MAVGDLNVNALNSFIVANPGKLLDVSMDSLCVLIFDSLNQCHHETAKRILWYFVLEANNKKQTNLSVSNVENITQIHVPVPTQPNSNDCGLYLIHLVKMFVTDRAKMMKWICKVQAQMPLCLSTPQKEVSKAGSETKMTSPPEDGVTTEEALQKTTCSKASGCPPEDPSDAPIPESEEEVEEGDGLQGDDSFKKESTLPQHLKDHIQTRSPVTNLESSPEPSDHPGKVRWSSRLVKQPNHHVSKGKKRQKQG
ncbi:Ulp1 protease [Melampsora larici-populina 98AG31]|uniref:Ulp1 protease n=1 Tax=Melampsora larici-populina (strain 98AG31 / pathotype 3-4-7) TaxID=747676 RepID=F4R810_MELLP|nr:Ulp1 protease [Melampsora larici-populina 98AG31]EGG11411.1 Ulp1 protease [Melampsora larici-populina 98AG31]